MKAAVLKGPGLLELDDLPDPLCPKGGALLEVKACAVCGTDVKMRTQGHRDLSFPRVLGHEMVGRIVEIDADSRLTKGDLVQVWPGIACGKCRPCLRGADNLCPSIKIMGFNCDGGFAQLLALPRQSLSGGVNLLPGNVDPALAALAEPLACCINGQEQACVSEGDRVLIYGGGPIGALHALLAELHGAEKIIVAERLPGRIRLLERHTSAWSSIRRKNPGKPSWPRRSAKQAWTSSLPPHQRCGWTAIFSSCSLLAEESASSPGRLLETTKSRSIFGLFTTMSLPSPGPTAAPAGKTGRL